MLIMLAACQTAGGRNEITVSRINVVDSRGVVRMVIAGDAPDPIVRPAEALECEQLRASRHKTR